MPDDLQEWEELLFKALKERKEKPPEDKQQPNNTLPAVIAAVL